MWCLQLATAVATAVLLWLAASSISSWHTATSMRSNIAALSQALDGSRSQIAALRQQLDSALSQQDGQHSR
jgi:Tfp pilus assembly protein FimT